MKKSIFTTCILASTIAMAAPAHATYYTYNTNLDNGIGKATVTIDTRSGTATYKGANINVTMTGSQIKNFKGGSTPPTQVIQADTIKGTFTKNGKTYNAYTSSYPGKPSFGFGSGGSSSQHSLSTQGKDKYGNTYNLNCGGNGGSSSSTSSTSSGGSTSTGSSGGSTSGGTTSSTSTGGSTSSTSGGTASSTSTGGSTSSTSTGGSTSSTSTGGSTSSTSTSSGGIGGSTSGGSTGGGSTGGTDVPAPGALLLFGLGAGALAFRRSRKPKA